MIKINRAEFLSAMLCAAVKDVRYYLNGICIDSEGFIVATDGHRMFVGKAETTQETVIINIKGKAPTKFETVTLDTSENNASFYNKNGELIQTCPLEVIDGRFPDWRRVSNYKEGKISAIGLNLSYLNDAAKAAKFFGKENAKIKTQDSASAVHVELSEDAYMVIMSCRI